jgi:hypothetical protein
MITTDEYQDLIRAKDERDKLSEELVYADNKLMQTEQKLKELVLLLTDGKVKVGWHTNELSICDLADGKDIAEYLNKNYMENGILTFTKERTNE